MSQASTVLFCVYINTTFTNQHVWLNTRRLPHGQHTVYPIIDCCVGTQSLFSEALLVLRKATISFVMSARMEQLGSNCTRCR